MTTILDFSAEKAKDFLLKEDSYSNIDLPEYFTFSELLLNIENLLKTQKISDNYAQDINGKPIKPNACENVNYKIIANKDGLYAWRPLQLIHPVLYVALVNIITEEKNWEGISSRFRLFQKNEKIHCMSIPMVSTDPKKTQKSRQILTWWKDVEQLSLAKALDFSYLYTTDITNCYGSIYTHSIPWALHGKDIIKNVENRKSNKFVGNLIDRKLQDMSYGQTNGIPQGSILMDFIAEMVLGYADLKLTERLEKEKINDYFIIRYRDDYKIFVNNQTDGDEIIKILTEVLIDLGMRLNPSKTLSSKNVILGAIKKDKLDLLASILSELCLKDNEVDEQKLEINNQKMLLRFYDFADRHPNSGQLRRLLSNFYKTMRIDCKKDNLAVLMSVITEIAFNSPSSYPICVAIISKILRCVQSDKEKLNYILRINKKFKKIPNTGFMDIWLQRISLKISPLDIYSDKLCKIANGTSNELWNSNWLNDNFKKVILHSKLINQDVIKRMTPIITQEEVDAFQPQYDEYR